jgi:nitrite reductase/ring-hydroxylating ferredoxin subunit
MKLECSLVTRRTFVNTLLGGWFFTSLAGGVIALLRFAFPTLGKEPDFVILKPEDYLDIPANSTKGFAWGGKLGLFFRKIDGTLIALKGVCSHMECNILYKPEERKFYCSCHKGWFDENGMNIKGPPPKPLEIFVYTVEEDKLIVARKGVKVELPKA